jgi:shikimate dehydrogenase
MRQFGLIGYPLQQSFSKKFFDEKFHQEHLDDCRFDNFSLANIAELPAMLNDNPQLRGFAITIPYKKEVMQFLSDRSGIPQNLNACNCIRIDGQGKLHGFNTDHTGFRKSLEPLLGNNSYKALVLGNGGASEAVIFALDELGISYEVVSRKLHGVSTLTYDDIDASIMNSHHLIINTTPLGMVPDTNMAPDIPYDLAGKDHLFYDLVYNPEMTLFLSRAEAMGARIKNGYEMLIIQAEENWKIWTS